ncbi:hypothetical protein HPB51_005128 [Rhipicephalus microplus]|uniref:CCHC-type domain-containing protein n=1 Tax=Rhipicephalus microplus TaxID=6941 RepID=A0A9J6EMM7_RHIMP|nr:hypothetical protein HPB51_005128 [Rhipicephalus microplus]
MAATPRRLLRQPIAVASTSAASTDDFFDPSSADDTSDDFEVSESSSDDDTPDQTPQTSTSTTKVSTTYGKDVLPNPARRMKFSSVRQPGAHLAAALRSGVRRFSRALDFFLLFFTTEVLQTNICDNTNKYAWMRILDRQIYARRDGSWEEVMPLEMLRFIGLIIYMGVVDVPRLHMYWRTTGIFSSLLPPNIMRRDRFFALLAFLSVGDPEDLAAAASDGKTWRVSWLLRHINLQSQNLFQPQRNLAVDERMVKSKARSRIRQYIQDKVTKFGYKLWVLADSNTGYTINFFVYTRKDRRGFPKELKDATWERRAQHGDVCWIREGNILFMQWKDRRSVYLMSTMPTANKHVAAKRRKKRGGQWVVNTVKKPLLVHEYNTGMLGMDKSDQIIATYNVLRKCTHVRNGRSVPGSDELRRRLPELFEKHEANLIVMFQGTTVSVIIDETTDDRLKSVVNVLFVQSAKTANAALQPVLVEVKFMDEVNSSIIGRIVTRTLTRYGVEFEDVSGFVSDNATYMMKSFKECIKPLCEGAVHVTCVTHTVNIVGSTLQASFPSVNKFVACMKKAFPLSSRKRAFYKSHLEECRVQCAKAPPAPVQSRWNSWIEAVEQHSAYFEHYPSLLQQVHQKYGEAACVHSLLKLLSENSTEIRLLVFTNVTTIDAVIKECRRLEQAKSRRILQQFQRLPNTAATSSCEATPCHPSTTEDVTRIVRRELEAAYPANNKLTLPDASTPAVALIQAVFRQEFANLGILSTASTMDNTGPSIASVDMRRRRLYSIRTRNPSEWRTADDKPICFRCGCAGHIARYCRS